jgi:phage shock protein C
VKGKYKMSGKRLYRSQNERMIAGVCGGIAEYLDIDPTLVRILFVLLFFVGGNGLLLYLILMFLVPMKPEASAPVYEQKPEEPPSEG